MHHVVEVLGLVRVEPHLALPGRAGQRHNRGHHVETVVRQGDAVIDHQPRVLTSWSAGPQGSVLGRIADEVREGGRPTVHLVVVQAVDLDALCGCVTLNECRLSMTSDVSGRSTRF
ncbi:hypothetical protein CTZ27_38215 [Streptomyces griseocarneus]|nr:hypothetical protein CTZ27_38215 [Streptomyces griseocarneus]